jgi:hypothetical protein
MTRAEKDEERENRIEDDVIVDAHDREEQVMGWYYYLAEGITFPFKAQCIVERSISPLKINEQVEVIDIASADDCEHDMLVMIRLMDRTFSVPLSQLNPIDVDDQTQTIIEDWQYWVARGYEF